MLIFIFSIIIDVFCIKHGMPYHLQYRYNITKKYTKKCQTIPTAITTAQSSTPMTRTSTMAPIQIVPVLSQLAMHVPPSSIAKVDSKPREAKKTIFKERVQILLRNRLGNKSLQCLEKYRIILWILLPRMRKTEFTGICQPKFSSNKKNMSNNNTKMKKL